MEEDEPKPKCKDDKNKLLRCIEWLEKQNDEDTEKLSLEKKNDIQFIIQNHAARKNFLLTVAEDDATVPNGVTESTMEPLPVSRYRLRVLNLNMECEWQACRTIMIDYDQFQKHVRGHTSEMHVIDKEPSAEYVCLWDVCGHKSTDFKEMVRHMNYHAYHSKLLAIGFNGRATLNLARCKKDSSKRNVLPVQPTDYACMWFDSDAKCDLTFDSYPLFLDHVKVHTNYSDTFLCSWAGCGARFTNKNKLEVHVRSHTGERLIACYHCGQHFALNRKLSDHLRRQNVSPNSPYICELCGVRCATEYLLAEHTRQHVSSYACSLCDMSVVSPAALANHVRYRHLAGNDTRLHECPHCDYKAITKWDVRMHILTHKPKNKRKRKRKNVKKELEDFSDEENSDESSAEKKSKPEKTDREYVCHMCTDTVKIFSRGSRLTTHLVKEHGAQWSIGHSRFRYQICADGKYRLTTTRYESLEVSEKIMDGYSSPKLPLTNLNFKVKQVAEATACTPRSYEITLKGDENADDDENVKEEVDKKPVINQNGVEILMCDVDEEGNIISTELINSNVIPKIER
ncbi:histone H4 transcription factor [Helicoverpa armigera]|uniref:histone H4 transcription factor n=1 Tax=Helicoverpa armigera TaxID=29058 RepID=UPI003083BD97